MAGLSLLLLIAGIDWPVAPTVTFPDGKKQPAIVIEIDQQQVLVLTDAKVEVRRNSGLVLEPQSEQSLKPRREVVLQVIELLHDKSDDLRAAAIETTRRLGRDLVEEDLGGLLHSARVDVRKVAALLLGDVKARDPAPLFALKWDKDTDVRKFAVRSAAKIGGPDAMSFCLDRADNDGELVVRREAIARLGDAGDLSVTPNLIDLADKLDGEPYLQGIAVRALKRLTNQNFDKNFRAWRRWWHTQAR